MSNYFKNACFLTLFEVTMNIFRIQIFKRNVTEITFHVQLHYFPIPRLWLGLGNKGTVAMVGERLWFFLSRDRHIVPEFTLDIFVRTMFHVLFKPYCSEILNITYKGFL